MKFLILLALVAGVFMARESQTSVSFQSWGYPYGGSGGWGYPYQNCWGYPYPMWGGWGYPWGYGGYGGYGSYSNYANYGNFGGFGGYGPFGHGGWYRPFADMKKPDFDKKSDYHKDD